MRKTLLLALIGSFTLATAAFAAPQNEGPEPYSAPDPVYTPHQIDSSVTFKNDKPVPTATDEQGSQMKDGGHS